jgi:YVTN family beta-propeller protein
VYRINIRQKIVDQTITVGTAPHGVVVNKAGTLVYVTNLLSDDLSVIDVATSKEVARVAVGEMPNGVSIWNKQTGGTP